MGGANGEPVVTGVIGGLVVGDVGGINGVAWITALDVHGDIAVRIGGSEVKPGVEGQGRHRDAVDRGGVVAPVAVGIEADVGDRLTRSGEGVQHRDPRRPTAPEGGEPGGGDVVDPVAVLVLGPVAHPRGADSGGPHTGVVDPRVDHRLEEIGGERNRRAVTDHRAGGIGEGVAEVIRRRVELRRQVIQARGVTHRVRGVRVVRLARGEVVRLVEDAGEHVVAVGAPQPLALAVRVHVRAPGIVVEATGDVGADPLAHRVEVLRGLGAVLVLARVRVDVAAHVAATGGVAVVVVDLVAVVVVDHPIPIGVAVEVLAGEGDRIAVQGAVLAVRRVAPLTATGAAADIRQRPVVDVAEVDRLGDRLDEHRAGRPAGKSGHPLLSRSLIDEGRDVLFQVVTHRVAAVSLPVGAVDVRVVDHLRLVGGVVGGSTVDVEARVTAITLRGTDRRVIIRGGVLHRAGGEPAGNVVRVALLALDRVVAETIGGPGVGVEGTGGVVVIEEGGAHPQVVEAEDGDRRRLDPVDVVTGAERLPVGPLGDYLGVGLRRQGLQPLVRGVEVLLHLDAVAGGAVGDVDGLGPHEGDRLPLGVDHRGAGGRVHHPHPRHLVRLDIGLLNIEEATAGKLRVEEGGEGEPHRVPDPRVGEDNGGVLHHRRLRVHHRAGGAGVRQITGEAGLQGTLVLGQDNLVAVEELIRLLRVRPRGALQIGIDVEVGPLDVTDIIGGVGGVTVAIGVVEGAEVDELGALTEAVVDEVVGELVRLVAVHQEGRLAVGVLGIFLHQGGHRPDLYYLRLDRVEQRQDTAVGEVEAGAVHPQLVVDGDDVVGAPHLGRHVLRRGGAVGDGDRPQIEDTPLGGGAGDVGEATHLAGAVHEDDLHHRAGGEDELEGAVLRGPGGGDHGATIALPHLDGEVLVGDPPEGGGGDIRTGVASNGDITGRGPARSLGAGGTRSAGGTGGSGVSVVALTTDTDERNGDQQRQERGPGSGTAKLHHGGFSSTGHPVWVKGKTGGMGPDERSVRSALQRRPPGCRCPVRRRESAGQPPPRNKLNMLVVTFLSTAVMTNLVSIQKVVNPLTNWHYSPCQKWQILGSTTPSG